MQAATLELKPFDATSGACRLEQFVMRISDELRNQAVQHPLDIDVELLHVAAKRIELLEAALISITGANSNWSMSMDDQTANAIHRLLVEAQTA